VTEVFIFAAILVMLLQPLSVTGKIIVAQNLCILLTTNTC
jgi:hypothetical protein